MLLKSLSSRLTLVPAVAFMCVALLPASARAGTLDQQQTNVESHQPIFSGASVTQTFTAQIDGQLDQVDLRIARIGDPGDLVVQIRTVAAGVPSGTVLASTTVPAADVPADGGGWVSVAISAPSVAGTEYAIRLDAPAPAATGCFDGVTHNCYFWADSPFDPYALGREFAAGINDLFRDAAFKTYVGPGTQADCQHGGWQNYGTMFTNQGACARFVRGNGKHPPNV